MRRYAAFDTNVLVASLLTRKADSATARVVNAIADGRIAPLYNQAILDEYRTVLRRAKFPFTEAAIRRLLLMIRQFGLTVSPRPTGEMLPDMDDLVFYEVVQEQRGRGEAWLITGNTRHFPPRAYIVTPAEMMAVLDGAQEQSGGGNHEA